MYLIILWITVFNCFFSATWAMDKALHEGACGRGTKLGSNFAGWVNRLLSTFPAQQNPVLMHSFAVARHAEGPLLQNIRGMGYLREK